MLSEVSGTSENRFEASSGGFEVDPFAPTVDSKKLKIIHSRSQRNKAQKRRRRGWARTSPSGDMARCHARPDNMHLLRGRCAVWRVWTLQDRPL